MAGEGNEVARATIRIEAVGAQQVRAEMGAAKTATNDLGVSMAGATVATDKLTESKAGLVRGFKQSIGAITSFIARVGAMIGVFTTAYMAGERLGEAIAGINREAMEADAALNKLGGSKAIQKLTEEIEKESGALGGGFISRLFQWDLRSESTILARYNSLQAQLTNAANAAAKERRDAEAKAVDAQIETIRRKTAEMHKESMTPRQREDFEYTQQINEFKAMEAKADDAVLKMYLQNARRVAKEAHDYRLVLIEDEANAALRAFQKRERAMADAVAKAFEQAMDRIDARTRSGAESLGGSYEEITGYLDRIERRIQQN